MILSLIQHHLETQGFDCTLLTANEVLTDQLMVLLGLDKQNRNLVLEIQSLQLPIPLEMTQTDLSSLPCRIKFRVHLPFVVEDMALNQVASLILFLNPHLDLPGFELDELKGEVSYRYIWMMKPVMFDHLLMQSIMGAIILNINLFADVIESLASGQLKFNDLLSTILETVNSSSSA